MSALGRTHVPRLILAAIVRLFEQEIIRKGKDMRLWILGFLIAAVAWSNSSTEVKAWGRIGHEVVCEIAFQELTPSARDRVIDFMRLDEDYRYFSKSCFWADAPKKRRNEHWVNVSRDNPNVTSANPCPVADKCVVSAIFKDMRDLAHSTNPEWALKELKYLGHWIGDVHQPIHVSFEDDAGGNDLLVSGGGCNGNFHALWDNCILDKSLGDDSRAIGQMLQAEVTDAERNIWYEGEVDINTVVSWAAESLEITINPDSKYCVLKGSECHYSDTEKTYAGGQLNTVSITNSYIDLHAPTVRLRLKQAGVRLGAALNQILSDESDLHLSNADFMPLSEIVAMRSVRQPAGVHVFSMPSVQGDLATQIERLVQRIDTLEQAVSRLSN